MRKIIGFLVIVTIAAMMSINAIAEEETITDTIDIEQPTFTSNSRTPSNPGVMYAQGDAYAGLLYAKSTQTNSNGNNVIENSGIGIKAGSFLFDNTDVNLSYVAGTWTIGTLSAGASEIRLMGSYHYPFVHFSNITLGGLIGVGYDMFNFQPTSFAGAAITGSGFVYEAGLDTRMNSLGVYFLYRGGSISYSTPNANLPLSTVEVGVNYILDASDTEEFGF